MEDAEVELLIKEMVDTPEGGIGKYAIKIGNQVIGYVDGTLFVHWTEPWLAIQIYPVAEELPPA